MSVCEGLGDNKGNMLKDRLPLDTQSFNIGGCVVQDQICMQCTVIPGGHE